MGLQNKTTWNQEGDASFARAQSLCWMLHPQLFPATTQERGYSPEPGMSQKGQAAGEV